MDKIINYQGRKIYYKDQGRGDALVFVHGYLESSDIWNDFVVRFTDRFRVLCIDVPGHGKSEILSQVHEMGEMARVISTVLQAEEIDKVVIVGHSMGGYITLEFAHLFPEMTRGYCLFHSTCFADNEEKKNNRDREISLVLCGKKMQIIHTNIPKGFAADNTERLSESVLKAKEIAASCTNEGIIALLNGMKSRSDHSRLLASKNPPHLVIWGRKDNYIGEQVFNKLVETAPGASFQILNNSGHMGFLEEPDCSFNAIMEFLDSLN